MFRETPGRQLFLPVPRVHDFPIPSCCLTSLSGMTPLISSTEGDIVYTYFVHTEADNSGSAGGTRF